MTKRPKLSNFVNLQVHRETKEKIVKTAKKRKEKVYQFVENLITSLDRIK